MKIKTLALLALSIFITACSKEKSNTNTPSKVLTSISSVVKTLSGEEYKATEIKGNPDYFILYFTASW